MGRVPPRRSSWWGSGLNLDSFVSFSQKPELRWFRVARLAVCSIPFLAQIERLRLRRRRHRLRALYNTVFDDGNGRPSGHSCRSALVVLLKSGQVFPFPSLKACRSAAEKPPKRLTICTSTLMSGSMMSVRDQTFVQGTKLRKHWLDEDYFCEWNPERSRE